MTYTIDPWRSRVSKNAKHNRANNVPTDDLRSARLEAIRFIDFFDITAEFGIRLLYRWFGESNETGRKNPSQLRYEST